MIFYTPSSAGQKLSATLWALARPLQLEGKAGTKYMFDTITALDGSKWLLVDTEYQVIIHEDADLSAVATALQPYIASGYLPADALATLSGVIDTHRGQSLVIYTAFPAFFKDQSKTKQQMEDAGLLATPKIQP